MSSRDSAETILRDAGRADDAVIDLAEAALGFALYDRPQLDLAPYRDHLAALARDLADDVRGSGMGVEARAAALSTTLATRQSYRGDRETYDDLANADLARVIDRRRGLPVALSILWLHAGRAQGWDMAGLNFPGHFVVRLDAPDGRVIIDPFGGGGVLTPADLQTYLTHMAGAEAELAPEHLAAVGNRAILLRLRNNIKIRLMREGRHADALRVLGSMLLVAPREASLWHEMATANAELGNLYAAMSCLGQAIDLAGPAERARLQQELRALRTKLN